MLEEKQDGTQVQVKSIEVSSIVSVLESLKKAAFARLPKSCEFRFRAFV